MKHPSTICLVVLLTAVAADAAPLPPDPLPPGAVRRLGPVRQLGPGRHGVAVFTSDGRRLFAGAGEESVHIWDALDQPPRTLRNPPDHRFSCIAVAPDGKLLAAGGTDGLILLREVETGKVLHSLSLQGDAVQDLAFSRDGKRLAGVGSGPLVRLWDRRGQDGGQITVDGGDVMCLAFAGDLLLCGYSDGVVRVWDFAAGKQTRAINTGGAVRSLAVTADGTTAFAEGDHHSVHAVAVATGQIVQTYEGHTGPILVLSCSADGRILVSGGADGWARVWDAASGEELQRLATPDGVTALAVSPDGRTLIVSNPDRSLERWDLERATGSPLVVGHRSEIEAVAFVTGGRTLHSWSETETLAWEVATGKPLGSVKADKPAPEKVVTSPGHRYRATLINDATNFTMLVSLDSGKEITLGGALRQLRALAFSADDRILAGAGCDGHVTLWESSTGQVLAEFKAHEGSVNCVAFAPGGKTFVTGGGDASVVVWALTACGVPLPERWRNPDSDDLESIWKALQGEPGDEAFTAMRALVIAPKKALPFLKGKLPTPLDQARMKRLLVMLDDDDFDVREKASKELETLGRDAEQALRDALKMKPSVEAKRRIDELLDQIKGDDSPRDRGWTRAVFVLDQIGTPEARVVLKQLAEGGRIAKAAEEARATLKRK